MFFYLQGNASKESNDQTLVEGNEIKGSRDGLRIFSQHSEVVGIFSQSGVGHQNIDQERIY
jgi:hypothetical protein